MSVPISPEDFQVLLRQAIIKEDDPDYKKTPQKELAILNFLYEVGPTGASVNGIIEEIISRLNFEKKKAKYYRELSYSSKRREIRRIIDNIREKFEDYFSARADVARIMYVDIHTFKINGELRYKLDVKHPQIRVPGIIDNATESFNKELIHNEIPSIVRENPLRIDFLGIAFMIGFESTDFKMMMIENIEKNESASYRFLLPDPDRELAQHIAEVHRRDYPVARNIINRIKHCTNEYRVVKSEIRDEKRNRIIMKYYEYNPFWRFRFLINRGINLHCKVFYPEKREQVMIIFNKDASMYILAEDAFDTMWADPNNKEVPLE